MISKMLSQNIEKKEILIFHTVLILLWLLFPLLAVFPMAIYLASTKTTKLQFFFYLSLIALVPSFINSTKLPVSDLASYYYVFDSLYSNDLLFSVTEYKLDPLFYFISFFFTRLTFGNNALTLLIWTFVIYIVSFYAIFKFWKTESPKLLLVGVIYIALFWGIGFDTIGHLLRQSIAMVFVLLAIAEHSINRRKSYFYLIVAVLMHISTIIFLPMFFISFFNRSFQTFFLCVFGGLGLVLGSSNFIELILPLLPMESSLDSVSTILAKLNAYEYKNDGNTPLFYMSFFFSISFSFYFYSKQNRFFWVICCFYFLTLFLFRNNLLFFFRFAFIYKFLAIFILYLLVQKFRLVYLCLFPLLLFYVPNYFFKIIKISEFSYLSNDFLLLLNTSVFEFIAYIL